MVAWASAALDEVRRIHWRADRKARRPGDDPAHQGLSACALLKKPDDLTGHRQIALARPSTNPVPGSTRQELFRLVFQLRGPDAFRVLDGQLATVGSAWSAISPAGLPTPRDDRSHHLGLAGHGPGVVQEPFRTIRSAQTIPDADQHRRAERLMVARPWLRPAAQDPRRAGRPPHDPTSPNACNTITVSNTRAGTVGRPSLERINKVSEGIIPEQPVTLVREEPVHPPRRSPSASEGSRTVPDQKPNSAPHPKSRSDAPKETRVLRHPP